MKRVEDEREFGVQDEKLPA